MCIKLEMVFEIESYACLAIKSAGNNWDPIPTAAAPAPNQALKLSLFGSTPPVTMILVVGIGPLMALTKPGPTTLPGKILTYFAPKISAFRISVKVIVPGIQGMSCLPHTSPTSGVVKGCNIKSAPIAMNSFACLAS